MKQLLELLFGHKVQSANDANVNDKVHSTIPSKRPAFDEWCKEFKVSMLHNRKPMEIY